MVNLAHVFTNTNWALLSEQKQGLLSAIERRRIEGDEAERLTGILHWMDAVQDAAKLDGFPVVFLTEGDDNA